MPTERLSMRHIREVLRLHYSVGMSQRAVARSLNLAQGTVSKYLNRTRRAGLASAATKGTEVQGPLPVPELRLIAPCLRSRLRHGGGFFRRRRNWAQLS
jgi:transposase